MGKLGLESGQKSVYPGRAGMDCALVVTKFYCRLPFCKLFIWGPPFGSPAPKEKYGSGSEAVYLHAKVDLLSGALPPNPRFLRSFVGFSRRDVGFC